MIITRVQRPVNGKNSIDTAIVATGHGRERKSSSQKMKLDQADRPWESIWPAVRICSSVRARFKFDLRLVLLSFSLMFCNKADEDDGEDDAALDLIETPLCSSIWPSEAKVIDCSIAGTESRLVLITPAFK